VTGVTDLMGLADLAEVSSAGPQEMTDGLGRKFWRMEGAQYLRWADTLVTSSRAQAWFFVGRWHGATNGTLCSIGAVGGTNARMLYANGGTASGLSYLSALNRLGSGDATNAKYTLAGTQMQLMWMASRATNATVATPDKNCLIGVNTLPPAQVAALTSYTGIAGGEIGRFAFNSGSFGYFDIYEIIGYAAELTDAQTVAITSEICAPTAWDFPTLTNQACFFIDSIGAGAAADPSQPPSCSSAMRLTAPGLANTLPNTWRVVNISSAGATTSTLITKRDDPVTVRACKLSGRNVMVGQVGINNMPADSAATIYAAIVAFWNTTTTGMLQNDWEGRHALNISTDFPTNQAIVVSLRALIRANLLNDTQSGPGQTYEGKLGLVELDLITASGQTVFSNSTDAGNATYYSDGVHPNPTGQAAMATGMDTPQYGYAQRILAAS